MQLKRGDLVTRKSYNHDTIFKITNIKNDMYYLKGLEVRLYADSTLEDLEKYNNKDKEDIVNNNEEEKNLDRSEYFYINTIKKKAFTLSEKKSLKNIFMKAFYHY